MKKGFAISTLLVVLALSSVARAEIIRRADFPELQALATEASVKRWTIFDLLEQFAQRLAAVEQCAEIQGTDLLNLNTNFSMGNELAYAILPLSDVQSVRLGLCGARVSVEVRLLRAEVTTQFRYMKIFEVNLHLQQRYVISDLRPGECAGIQGVQAEYFLGSADVVSVRYRPATARTSAQAQVRLSWGPSPDVDLLAITQR